MRSKFILGAVAALAAGAMSLGMAVAPASAMPTGSSVQLCNEDSTPLCMNGYDGSGGAVKAYDLTPGNAQDVDVALSTSSCDDGLVSSDCPFTPGLGLNDAYIGDPIVTITNVANRMTYRSDSGADAIIEQGGGGDGQLWVEYDSSGLQLINVWASDQNSAATFACTEGYGKQVQLVWPLQDTNCLWQFYSGS